MIKFILKKNIKKIYKIFCNIVFVKFILVGIVNTVIGTIIMFVCYNIFSLGYYLSSSLNYIVGSIISYFLNRKYTFNYNQKGFIVILRFFINILFCYLVSYILAKKIILIIFENYSKKFVDNISMLLGMTLYVILNYLLQRFFVFRRNID